MRRWHPYQTVTCRRGVTAPPGGCRSAPPRPPPSSTARPRRSRHTLGLPPARLSRALLLLGALGRCRLDQPVIEGDLPRHLHEGAELHGTVGDVFAVHTSTPGLSTSARTTGWPYTVPGPASSPGGSTIARIGTPASWRRPITVMTGAISARTRELGELFELRHTDLTFPEHVGQRLGRVEEERRRRVQALRDRLQARGHLLVDSSEVGHSSPRSTPTIS